MSYILLIAGHTCSGKNTITDILVDNGYVFWQKYKTREPRSSENPKFFITQHEFRKKVSNVEIVIPVSYKGELYGNDASFLKYLNEGKKIIGHADVNTVIHTVDFFAKKVPVYPFLLYCDLEDAIRRLDNREPKEMQSQNYKRRYGEIEEEKKIYLQNTHLFNQVYNTSILSSNEIVEDILEFVKFF